MPGTVARAFPPRSEVYPSVFSCSESSLQLGECRGDPESGVVDERVLTIRMNQPAKAPQQPASSCVRQGGHQPSFSVLALASDFCETEKSVYEECLVHRAALVVYVVTQNLPNHFLPHQAGAQPQPSVGARPGEAEAGPAQRYGVLRHVVPEKMQFDLSRKRLRL